MGMKARGAVLAVAVWLMVVAGTSALAWVVVDKAGRVAVSTPTGSGNAGPTPTGTAPTGSPTGTATTGTATTGTATTGTATTGTATTGTAATATATPQPTPATPPVQDDGSTSVVGGQVGVRCVGSGIALRYAQPDDGWSVEVGSGGPEQVQVTFRRSGSPEAETHSTASCQRGTPTFSQESEAKDNSSDE